MKVRLSVCLILLFMPLSTNAQIPQWGTFGPAAGAVSLAIDPTNTGTLYAANSGSVFKSTDGGANWRHTTGLALAPGQAISIVIDPKNPRNVYAGGYREVFKSTDGGNTWTELKIDNGFPFGYWHLELNPRDPNIIFAASGGDNDLPGSGLWKSIDGGGSWRKTALNALPMNVIIDSRNPDVVYAWTYDAMYQSRNGGEDWNQIASGNFLLNLAIDVEDSAILYLGANNGVFKSTDGGKTWSNTPVLFGNGVVVSVDPYQPKTIYASSLQGSFKSTDRGETWRAMSGVLPDVIPLAWDPKDRMTIYYSTADGLKKSTNGGMTWRRLSSGLGTANVERIVVDPHRTGSVYAFASGGVFKSVDGGHHWNLVASNINEFAHKLVFDPQDARIVYATRPEGILKSTDGGNSWSPTGFPGWGPSPGLRALDIDPRSPNTLYAAANGQLLKSTDGASSWLKISALPEGSASLRDLFVNPGEPDVLYGIVWRFPGLVAIPGQLFRSADSGVTWSPVTLLYNNSVLNPALVTWSAIPVFDPQNSRTLYAASGLSVYKSTDGGSVWSYIGQVADEAGMSVGWVVNLAFALAVDSVDSNTVYAGTSSGLFRSVDGGITWSRTSPAAPRVHIRDLVIERSSNRLYAATYGSGVLTTFTSLEQTPAPILKLQPTSFCVGTQWNLTVSGAQKNAAIRLFGNSNGQPWEVTPWATTNANGEYEVKGSFTEADWGYHTIHVEVGGASSNEVSFFVCGAAPTAEGRQANPTASQRAGPRWNTSALSLSMLSTPPVPATPEVV